MWAPEFLRLDKFTTIKITQINKFILSHIYSDYLLLGVGIDYYIMLLWVTTFSGEDCLIFAHKMRMWQSILMTDNRNMLRQNWTSIWFIFSCLSSIEKLFFFLYNLRKHVPWVRRVNGLYIYIYHENSIFKLTGNYVHKASHSEAKADSWAFLLTPARMSIWEWCCPDLTGLLKLLI